LDSAAFRKYKLEAQASGFGHNSFTRLRFELVWRPKWRCPSRILNATPARRTMNYDQVLPQVFVGSCPARTGDIDLLKRDAGITAVLNLQTAEDFDQWQVDWDRLLEYYRESGVELCHLPVRDFDPDDLRGKLPQCADALNELLRGGHSVYVHCSAGINRSPSTVVAYLHWFEEHTLDEALNHVARHRSCDPYVSAIAGATEDRARAG